MKRLLSLALALCLIASCAALFCGCGEDSKEGFPVTVGDTEIKDEPKRVIVLNDAFADIIVYTGYDGKLVGRAFECDQDMLNVLPSVGSASSPAIDVIESLNPDLIISDGTLNEKSRNKIDALGVTVLNLAPATTQEEIKQLYIDLGAALGGDKAGREKGEEAYENLFNLLDEYSTTTGNIVVTDAYLYLDDQGNYCTFVKDSVEAKIFGYNGAMNVFASKTSPEFRATDVTDDQGNVTPADEMYIRYAAPTYLFLDGTVAKDGTIDSAVYDKLLADPNLSKLSALTEGRISFIPRKNFYRPGVTFEETLFKMIDELNKDEEAAEASENPTTAAVVTEAPTAAPATQAVATEAPTEAQDAADNGDDIYVDENGDIYV